MNLLRGFWAAPLLAAALLWASFAPVDLGFLAPAGWFVLLLSMRLRGGERCARQALVGQFAFFTAGLSWIAPLVSVGWLFTAFWCAAIEALWARCMRPSFRAARAHGDWTWVIAAPLLHVGFDLVRTVLATGFPWLITGYSGWANPVLLGSADLIGVHGATLAIIAAAAALAEVVARRAEGRPVGRAAWAPAAGLWIGLAAWAAFKPAIETTPGPTVLLLQASIPQELKEARATSGNRRLSLEEWWGIHEQLAAEGFADAAATKAATKAATNEAPDLVVWPETMVPATAAAPLVPGRPFEAVEPGPSPRTWNLGTATSRRVTQASRGAWTLAGIVSEDQSGGQRNTALLLDPQGLVAGHQDKQHLTPGGETLLFLDLLPAGIRAEVTRKLMDFAGFIPNLVAGEGASLLPLRQGDRTLKLGVLICYESIFPELTCDMARAGADVLVNISNYGWFAGTAEMEQALAMARFRAAELRRPFVLASNNGISAVIAPDGAVVRQTAADVRTHLLARVPIASGATPFQVVGEGAGWVLGAAGAGLALRSALRARRNFANAARETS